jgi:hypothetical protein
MGNEAVQNLDARGGCFYRHLSHLSVRPSSKAFLN